MIIDHICFFLNNGMSSEYRIRFKYDILIIYCLVTASACCSFIPPFPSSGSQ